MSVVWFLRGAAIHKDVWLHSSVYRWSVVSWSRCIRDECDSIRSLKYS